MLQECKSNDTGSSDVSKISRKWSHKPVSEKVKVVNLVRKGSLLRLLKIYGKKESSLREIAEK